MKHSLFLPASVGNPLIKHAVSRTVPPTCASVRSPGAPHRSFLRAVAIHSRWFKNGYFTACVQEHYVLSFTIYSSFSISMWFAPALSLPTESSRSNSLHVEVFFQTRRMRKHTSRSHDNFNMHTNVLIVSPCLILSIDTMQVISQATTRLSVCPVPTRTSTSSSSDLHGAIARPSLTLHVARTSFSPPLPQRLAAARRIRNSLAASQEEQVSKTDLKLKLHLIFLKIFSVFMSISGTWQEI